MNQRQHRFILALFLGLVVSFGINHRTSDAAPRKKFCRSLLLSEAASNLSITPEGLISIFIGSTFSDNVERYFLLHSKKVQNEVLRILSRENFKGIQASEIQRALYSLREELVSLGGDIEETWGKGGSTIFDLLKAIPESTRNKDIEDMARGWGSVPFLYDSKVYRNEKYFLDLVKAEQDMLRTERRQYMTRQNVSDWADKVRKASGIKNLQLETFSTTGSEANATVFRYADRQVLKRFHRNRQGYVSDGRYEHGNVLFVGPVYFDLRNGSFDLQKKLNFWIENSATVKTFKEAASPSSQTIAREKEVLREIEKTLEDPEMRVGALFIEPVSTKEGLQYHSASFLRKIRDLCDRYEVLLFVDEIMTGFGRTGKFFSFQHYRDFKPDYVSFGKSFQVNGVLRFSDHVPSLQGITTEMIPAESLVKSSHSLDYFMEANLLEQIQSNSEYVRSKVIAELKRKRLWGEGQKYIDRWFGPGYFWYNDYDQITHPFLDADFHSAMGRYLPALDMTKKDWDRVLKKAFDTWRE